MCFTIKPWKEISFTVSTYSNYILRLCAGLTYLPFLQMAGLMHQSICLTFRYFRSQIKVQVFILNYYSFLANNQMNMKISLSLMIKMSFPLCYSSRWVFIWCVCNFSMGRKQSCQATKSIQKKETVKDRFQANKNCHERKTKYLINGEWAWKIQMLKLR